MSTTIEQPVRCPCGGEFPATLWSSVNVQRDPDLKEALLAGRLNVVKCPECGQMVYAERFLLYHDPSTELLVFVYPTDHAGERERWLERTRRDYAAAQETVDKAPRIRYPPQTVFGFDDLVALVAREQEEQDQGDILEAMGPKTAVEVWRLRPSLARAHGVPARLPLGPVVIDSRESRLKEGLKRVLRANDRLTVYAALDDLLVKASFDLDRIAREAEVGEP